MSQKKRTITAQVSEKFYKMMQKMAKDMNIPFAQLTRLALEQEAQEKTVYRKFVLK